MNDGIGKFFLVDPLPLHKMTQAKHGQEQDQNKTDPGYSGKNPRFQLSEKEDPRFLGSKDPRFTLLEPAKDPR